MRDVLLVNRYRIIKKLGEGGMGKIWQVYDTVEKQEVALKQYYRRDSGISGSKAPTTRSQRITLSTIKSDSTEADLRFKQEFRTMVKLKHPNTVNVFDYGVLENGDDYITMEIVSGEELSDIIKKRQLTFPQIYRVLIQICQVLNFIHSRLLVHRDIKPENIRITPEGNVKMMDFGLMDQMGLPSNGQITGTIAYLPPEVAQGGIIDARSDLYSLGCLAYELVVGHPPFTAPKITEVIKQHINELPKSLKEIRKDTPAELEKIILKLLAKNQNERYQITAGLLNDLIPLSSEKIVVETLEQRKSYLNCSELIGRENEMQKLKDTFSSATQGKGQSVFVAAPAGVGKSRLIQEFKLKVQLAEVPYLEGQCLEQGMTPYQPLADAFRSLLPLAKKEVLDTYGPVLVKIIPELEEKGYKPAPALDEVAERVRFFEQVGGWLKEMARITPFVICIEDLHWADGASLELLNACIRELKDSSVVILGAFRDDEVEPTSIIFQTEEEELTHLMRLSTLSEDDVGLLIKGMLGRIELTDEFTVHIFTATGGNAFFVSESMRTLIEEEQLKLEHGYWILPVDISTLDLPTSIEATILRRLNLLGSESLELARIAAVVGRGLDLSFLKSLSGVEEEKLFEIIDELLERQFIKTEDKQYVFTHDRVRETLYAQLEEDKRREIHEKTGTIIEERFAKDKSPVIIELAYHFSRGRDRSKSVQYLIQAGDILKSNRDLPAANILWRQALEILEAIDYPNKETLLFQLRDRLVEINFFTDPPYGVEICERQAEELHRLTNIRPVVKIMRVLFTFINMLPLKIQMKIKDKLVNQPPKKNIRGDFSTIIYYLVKLCAAGSISAFFAGDMRKASSFIEQAFQYLPDFNGTGYAMLHAGSFVVWVYTGRTKTGAKRFLRSYDILDELDTHGLLKGFDRYVFGAVSYACICYNVFMGNKINWDLWKRGLKSVSDDKFFDHVFWHHTLSMEYKMYRGMYKDFQEDCEKAKEMLRKTGRSPTLETYYHGYVAGIEIICGNYEKAMESVEKHLSLAQRINCHYQICLAKAYKAYVMFKRGEKEESTSLIKKVIESAAKQNYICTPLAMTYLAEMYLEMEDYEQAKMMLSKAEEFNNSFEDPQKVTKARIRLLNAEIMRRKREFEQCQDTLQKILHIAEETENPLLRAWFHEMMTKIYTDLMQSSKAESSLAEAQKIYDQLGIEKKQLL